MFLSQFSHDSPLSQTLHRRLNAKKDINYDDNDINYVSEEAVNESCFLLGLANSMSERYVEICTTPTSTTADNNDDKDDNDDGVYRQYYCQT